MTGYRANVFRLGKEGLERVLGSLEARVMEEIWQLNRGVTVREVQAALAGEKSLSFNTIMTVMNRLVEKGLLRKKGTDGVNRYLAVQDRDQFMQNLVRGVASGLVKDFGDYAVAQFFAAILDKNPAALTELERLLKQVRERQVTGGDSQATMS